MRHDKELIIFLRIDSVTVNRPKPPLIGINETFVTHACGSELHLDLNVILRLLCSCTQLSCLDSFGSSGPCSYSPSCQGRCHSCGSQLAAHVSAHSCSTLHNPSRAKAARCSGAAGGMWKMAQFRENYSREVPGAGHTLF